MVDINKYLKDKYNYTFDGDLDKFYSLPFIEFEGEGKFARFWVVDGDNRYLFKVVDDITYNAWGELLCDEFASKIGIDTAEYMPAKFNGKRGFLTKSFLSEDSKLIFMDEVIQRYISRNKGKYNGVYLPDALLNNYYDLNKIIMEDNNFRDDEKSNISYKLKELLCFDLITIQEDRHPKNYGLIKDSNGYRTAPLYDNEMSFGLLGIKDGYKSIRGDIYNFVLSYTYHENGNFSNCMFDIRRNSEICDILDNMTNVFTTEFMTEAIEKIEDKYNVHMDDLLKIYLVNLYDSHINYIKEKLSEVKTNNEVRRIL